jgi:hypothetical protein
MSEGKGPATGDREHLERYLKWRAEFRRRAARRRFWVCSVAVLSLAVLGFVLVTWRTEWARDTRARVVFERRQAPPKSVATTSHDSEPRAPLSAPAAGTVVERTPAERGSRVAARETPRMGPSERSSGASKARALPPRQPSSLPSSLAEDPARTPDVAAGLRVADASRAPDAAVSPPPSPTSTSATPATVLTSPLLEEKVADRSEAVATVTPTNPTPDDAQTVAPPPSKRESVTGAVAPPTYSARPKYVTPPPPSYRQAPSYAPAQIPAVRSEVVYAYGRYVLYGDGVYQPWQWVWVPSALPPPPPPPPR